MDFLILRALWLGDGGEVLTTVGESALWAGPDIEVANFSEDITPRRPKIEVLEFVRETHQKVKS